MDGLQARVAHGLERGCARIRRGGFDTRVIGILALNLSMGTVLIVNTVLAYFANDLYPELPYSSVTLLSTAFSLSALPGSLFGGAVAGRTISFKRLALAALAALAAFGCLPFFVSSFPLVLVARVCGGFAQGVLTTLYGGLVALTLLEFSAATRVQGIAAIVGCGAGILYQVLATSVAAFDVRAVWLVHAFLLVPCMLVALFLPGGVDSQCGCAVRRDEASSGAATRIPLGAFGIIVGYCTVLSFVSPQNMSASAVILGEGLGGASEIALVCVLYTLGGIVSGLLYRHVLTSSGRWFFAVTLVLEAVGALLIAFVRSVPGYGAGMLLSGIGFYMLMPGCTAFMVRMMSGESFTKASGLFSAAGYLAQFATTPLLMLVTLVFGDDDQRSILVIGAAVITFVALAWGLGFALLWRRR